MTTITQTAEGVGGKRMVRLARAWVGGEVCAAALLRRTVVSVYFAPPGMVAKNVRDIRADYALPQDMLLALDTYGTLHLMGMRGLVLSSPRETLRRWPAGTATVDVAAGGGWFRPLSIAYEGGSMTAAAPYMGSRQKAALALMERLTA
jgi:hypothetical protein